MQGSCTPNKLFLTFRTKPNSFITVENPYKVTFRQFAESINKDWTLDEWFQWPPDMFALCASIVNRTGLYRFCLIDMDWWNNKTWKIEIDDLSDKWTMHCSNLLSGIPAGEHPVKNKYYQTLLKEWKAKDEINLDHFRPLSPLFEKKTTTEQDRTRDLARALLYFYILADASCGSLGLLGQPLKKEYLKNRIFMTVANLLLNNTGSLSTVTKFHGVVLPKMRTPRSGLIPRSLTHQLTFHNTEVEVTWRAFPRLDDRRKSLNILAVPYPEKIETTDLEPTEDNYQHVRYFKGKTNRADNDTFIKNLVARVWTCAKEKDEVDIIVFPEMALSETQYHRLLEEFSSEFKLQKQCWQLPIIITGIAKNNTKKTGYPGMDETFHNEVRMAVFFGGEWYTTTQRKHHRWQLDRSQIRQYGLEAFFSSDQRWFEFSSIAQRRLTILAPYDWLALSALICEDLARQEPVGEVIRGIGPSLLMALLSDGPQLQSRWSARYASVLADDPGTAVLSLTSEGMAKKSKAPDLKPVKSPVVGLWKDMIRGYKEFALKKDSSALLFTISATFEQEFTLDGRSDGGFASVFQLDNIQPKQIKFTDKPIGGSPTSVKPPSDRVTDKGDEWRNIRELSALQFAVDALLDILIDETTEQGPKQTAIDLIFTLLLGQNPKNTSLKFKERIISSVAIAWKSPTQLGIAATPPGKRSETLQKAVDDLKQFVKIVQDFPNKGSYKLLEAIMDRCSKMLENKQRKPENNQIPMAFLYHIYNRIGGWEPSKKVGYEIEDLNIEIAVTIRKKIIEMIKPKQEIATSIEDSNIQVSKNSSQETDLATNSDKKDGPLN